MAKASIQDRLAKLENKRGFLKWLVWRRFLSTLSDEELLAFARDLKWPDPLPSRLSSVDPLDRKSLLKLWEEDKRMFGGRSPQELKFYKEKGFWPEHRCRLHFSVNDGKLTVEWRIAPEEAGAGPEPRSLRKEG